MDTANAAKAHTLSLIERYYELLNQRPEYYHLLSDFFRRQDAPKLAWIHHINMEQLDKAGEALVKASLSETRLRGQQASHLDLRSLMPWLIQCVSDHAEHQQAKPDS